MMRVRRRPQLRAQIGGWGDSKRLSDGFLKQVGYAVEKRAKENAPIDTGRLRSSIGTAAKGQRARVGPKAEAGDALRGPTLPNRVYVGSGANYALPVHERHPTKSHYLKRALIAVSNRLTQIGKGFKSRMR